MKTFEPLLVADRTGAFSYRATHSRRIAGVPLPIVSFGGLKRSGYGREPRVAGIREFVSAETVWQK